MCCSWVERFNVVKWRLCWINDHVIFSFTTSINKRLNNKDTLKTRYRMHVVVLALSPLGNRATWPHRLILVTPLLQQLWPLWVIDSQWMASNLRAWTKIPSAASLVWLPWRPSTPFVSTLEIQAKQKLTDLHQPKPKPPTQPQHAAAANGPSWSS